MHTEGVLIDISLRWEIFRIATIIDAVRPLINPNPIYAHGHRKWKMLGVDGSEIGTHTQIRQDILERMTISQYGSRGYSLWAHKRLLRYGSGTNLNCRICNESLRPECPGYLVIVQPCDILQINELDIIGDCLTHRGHTALSKPIGYVNDFVSREDMVTHLVCTQIRTQKSILIRSSHNNSDLGQIRWPQRHSGQIH